MSHQYSTAFSHLVLAGTGIFCLMQHSDTATLSFAAYAIVSCHSVLGVWRWGNPDYGSSVDTPYVFTGFLQSILVLPLFTTEIWLKHGMQRELAYLHCLAAALPFTMYLADKAYGEMNDAIIGINCLSLGGISFMNENYYGIAAAVSYLINHFFLRGGQWSLENIPVIDLFNYGLCFFCYFVLRAL